MRSQPIRDVFCLYLWRSLETPGTLYLAKSIDNAQAVCAELIDAGYLVKVSQMGTNTEYELRDGKLIACAPTFTSQAKPVRLPRSRQHRRLSPAQRE